MNLVLFLGILIGIPVGMLIHAWVESDD